MKIKLFIYYIKKFYEQHRFIIFSLFVISIITIEVLMAKTIILDYPLKNNKNINQYYNSLSQLFGGLIGGTLTLLGVIITIYIANNDRKNDMIIKDKPRLLIGENVKLENNNNILVPILDTTYETNKKNIFSKSEINKVDRNSTITNYSKFDFYVTNNADCILEGIFIDKSFIYPFEKMFVLKKNNTYSLDLSNYYFVKNDKTVVAIDLICTSLNERKYFYSLASDNYVKIINKRKVIMNDVDFLGERTKEYLKIYNKVEKKLEDDSWNYIIKKLREKSD